MYDELDLTGKLYYRVSVIKNNVYEPVGGRVRPVRFRNFENAQATSELQMRKPGVIGTLIMRVEEAYYSDIETRDIFKNVTYTGIEHG